MCKGFCVLAKVFSTIISSIMSFAHNRRNHFKLHIISLILLLISHQTNSQTCISELPLIPTQNKTHLPLTSTFNLPSTPEFSTCSSTDYNPSSKTLILAGEYISNNIHYSYFFGYNKNMTKIKFHSHWPSLSSSKNQIKQLLLDSKKSWTRVISHPTKDIFFIIGYNIISAHNITHGNGEQIWTSDIKLCTNDSTVKTRRMYTDAAFTTDYISVVGTCYNTSNKTLVMVDKYYILNGERPNENGRILCNIRQIIYPSLLKREIDFGFVPPDVTIVVPVNGSLVDGVVGLVSYFYVAVNHFVFQGIVRFEKYNNSKTYKIVQFITSDDNPPQTVLNPSAFTHKAIVPTKHTPGLITLMDTNMISILVGEMTHFLRYSMAVVDNEINGNIVYNNYTWYGTHHMIDVHFDWTLNIDHNYEYVYVTTAPSVGIDGKRESTIAKHSVHTGKIHGGQRLDFYAMDSTVIDDGNIISVGFDWYPKIQKTHMSSIFDRLATFQLISSTVNNDSACVGCVTNHYGSECEHTCECANGYCSDDLLGNGDCYCTLQTYGDKCANICDCSPLSGLCNHGVSGTGHCSVCFPTIDITNPVLSYVQKFPTKYGNTCELECPCSSLNGICDPRGETSNGECVVCRSNSHYGKYCNITCDCNAFSEYCDYGVSGGGCTATLDNFFSNVPWYAYVITLSVIFIVLFGVVWRQTYLEMLKNDSRRSIPCCTPYFGRFCCRKGGERVGNWDDGTVEDNNLAQPLQDRASVVGNILEGETNSSDFVANADQ